MKTKLLILTLSLIVLTGCTDIKDKSIDEITSLMLSENKTLANNVYDGYKYYIPKGIKLIKKDEYNATLIDEANDRYYLYIDVVSYYNEEKLDYKENNKSYYSKKLFNNEKEGYLEINKIGKENYYFVEYMYNYGKIESYVEEKNINNAIINMSSILNSLKFNRKVLKTTIGKEKLDYKETTYNVMKPKGNKATKDTYLEYEEKYGMYEGYGGANKEEEKIEIQED